VLSAREGDGVGLNGFEEVCGPERFSVFVMVSELLERAEERRDGTEKDLLRFWKDDHEKRRGTVISSAWQYRQEGGE